MTRRPRISTLSPYTPLSRPLVGAARHVDGDRDLDLGMQRDRHLVQADALDRRIERDLAARDAREAALVEEGGDVAARHRAVELAGLRGLAQHHEALAVEAAADLLRFAAHLGVARLEVGLHAFVLRLVLLGGS